MTFETSTIDADAPPRPPRARVLAVGVLAGGAAGLFGVGGGIVIVPALVVVVAFAQRRAHATSLAAIVVISLSGAVGYAVAGEISWPIAAAMSAGGLVGAPVGTHLLQRLPQHVLQLGFAGLLLVTAVRIAIGGGGDGELLTDIGVLGFIAFVALGFAGGVVAGLMGVGGGIITVPALTILAGLPLVVAKGTSLAVIVPTALVGTLRNGRSGEVDLGAAGLVAGGGIITAFAASQVSLDLDPQISSVSFAALLTVTALRLGRKAWRAGWTGGHG